MAVWDFLKNALNIGNNEAPKIEPVLIGDAQYKPATKLDRAKDVANLGLSKLKNSKLYQGITGIDDKIENAFLGKLIDSPVENTTTITQDNNGNTTISSGVGTPTRDGGIINDLTSGFRENYTTKFNPQNLMGNDKKGFVYRLGEGLGTIGRMLESPLGRGLAVAGAVGALGGSAGDALAYGLGTTAQNQQNRSADRLYRNQLETQGIDLNNVRGYITPQAYNAMLQAKQLQDNAEWRKANLLTQQAQQRALEDYRNKELGLGYAKLEADKEAREAKAKGNKNLGNLEAVSNQLARFEETFKTMPGKIESNTLGRLRNATGFQTPNEANFNSQRTLLFNKIARDLGGEKGVLSDQDIKRIEASLPNYTDSYEQKQAKMQAIYDLLEDRLTVEGVTLDKAETSQKDSLGIL